MTPLCHLTSPFNPWLTAVMLGKTNKLLSGHTKYYNTVSMAHLSALLIVLLALANGCLTFLGIGTSFHTYVFISCPWHTCDIWIQQQTQIYLWHQTTCMHSCEVQHTHVKQNAMHAYYLSRNSPLYYQWNLINIIILYMASTWYITPLKGVNN